MHCIPHVVGPIVHPPRCYVQHHFQATVVPHVHPSHTTHVNHHLFQHQHYFPHTESVVNQVANQQIFCGGPGPFPWGY
ncbi:MAG: spore coat protein [Bacillales bacterium]|uniref:Spore coat protein D n=1 Tax=Parageobacillus thermantarcticus TaxID=186116 RepID=A0A1I0SWP4_9BACL|nr:CotD family spore coat protein [Parageobacillus thermantarcticus]SFA43827.1 spore coat protein D [Parageobacillus thermantarcticus]